MFVPIVKIVKVFFALDEEKPSSSETLYVCLFFNDVFKALFDSYLNILIKWADSASKFIEMHIRQTYMYFNFLTLI